MGSVAYVILWLAHCHRWEKVMEQFLEALRQQFSEEQIQKGQELLEDLLDITNGNGEEGYIAANLFYSLMTDELQKFVDDNEGNTDEYTEIK